MLFVAIFEWNAESDAKIYEHASDFKLPKEIKIIADYVLTGRRKNVIVLESSDESSLIKFTDQWTHLGNYVEICPAVNFEEAVKAREEVLQTKRSEA